MNRNLLLGLGVVYSEDLKQPADAIKAWEQVIAIDPGSAQSNQARPARFTGAIMIMRTASATAMLLALTGIVATADTAKPDLDRASQLKEGVSTREDAVKLLGKPACESMVDGCAMCTWSDGKRSISLKFHKAGVLDDRKEWRH